MKTKIHTSDIFNNVNRKTRIKYFDFCHKKALASGLTCKCTITDHIPKLEMWGTKWQFLKYYLRTLLKCDYKLNDIKRCISILIT